MTQLSPALRPMAFRRPAQLLAAVAGGGLLGYLAALLGAWGIRADQEACSGSTSICLTWYRPASWLFVVLLVLGGYLATAYLLRIPQAPVVAGPAAVLALLLHFYATAVAPLQRPPVWATVLLTGLALAVLVALRLWPTRTGVAVLLGALLLGYGVQAPLRDYLAERHTADAVQRTGLPQLHPQAPGYRLLRVSVPDSGDAIVYDFASTTAPLSDYSKKYGYIPTAFSVQISHVPATFRPPTDCATPQPGPFLSGACTPAGPGRWSVTYLQQTELVEERHGMLLAAYITDSTSRATLADLTRALDSTSP